MMELKSVDWKSAAKMCAVMYGFIAAVIAVIYGGMIAVVMLITAAASKDIATAIVGMVVVVVLGVIITLVGIVVYAAMGAVIGAAMAVVYNFCAKRFGGIKLELATARK
jgi:hypothetical protein